MVKAPAPEPSITFLHLLLTHRRGEIPAEADGSVVWSVRCR